MEVKIKQGSEMLDATIEIVDGVMVVSPKEYFKTRDKNVLQRSKELERKVDSFLAQLVTNQQTSLFP